MLSTTSPIHYSQQAAQRSRWLSQLAKDLRRSVLAIYEIDRV
jgi:hypothetical protein